MKNINSVAMDDKYIERLRGNLYVYFTFNRIYKGHYCFAVNTILFNEGLQPTFITFMLFYKVREKNLTLLV